MRSLVIALQNQYITLAIPMWSIITVQVHPLLIAGFVLRFIMATRVTSAMSTRTDTAAVTSRAIAVALHPALVSSIGGSIYFRGVEKIAKSYKSYERSNLI